MKTILAALAFVAAAGGVQAQGFNGMQYDQPLLNAINEMTSGLAGACNMGQGMACQGYNYLMGNANAMMGASNACMQGNQMGCQYYAMYYQQMNNDYMTYQQQIAMSSMPPVTGVNPLGATHQERMQAIQNFGAANTQNWQNHMNQMESNHQSFIDSIRN